ncbi:MAG TPA: cupin domain-containing protein [Bryobacteraceae bacterium]|nr:cupin domain-containing protein [Bryobacteraceae bacterium]
MRFRTSVIVAGSALAAAVLTFTLARTGAAEEPSWAPKPVQLTPYAPPHKPVTRLAELRARHQGQGDWRYVVVDDDHIHGEWISSAPGTKVSRRFHPDTVAWWIVMDGQIKFEIEGQDPFVATKGTMVQVPMQTIFAMETVGDKPALRFEANIAHAKTLYPQDVQPPELPGFTWMKVTLHRTPAPLDPGTRWHVQLDELAREPQYKGGNFMYRFVNNARAAANVIYGYEKNLPPLNPNDKGHYHPECAEFWLIMAGQIRYPIEGQGVIIANEGDIVYVPPFTFHAPRFYGAGPSCRLAMNGYPNIAHLFAARAE